MLQSIEAILIQRAGSDVHLPIPSYVNNTLKREQGSQKVRSQYQVDKLKSILSRSEKAEPWQADNDYPLRHAKLVSVD